MNKYIMVLLFSAPGFWLYMAQPVFAQQNHTLQPSPPSSKGAELVFNPTKGNCIACHQLPNEPKASDIKANIGPALAGIKQRFPNGATLREIIADASRRNPNTIMPPYGKHRILSEAEIEAVVAYLQTQ